MVEYFVETKHCLVFIDRRDDGFKKYINKTNGTVHVLCEDSLCKHENCAARYDIYDGSGSLVYAPESGRLCWAQCATRIHSEEIPYNRLRWEIVSIDIDNMDFTIRRHYVTKPGDKLTGMRYSEGKLYFLTRILLNDGETEWRLNALSLEDDSVETVGKFSSSGFTVRDGVVYYERASIQTLNSWDMASGTKKTLYDPLGQGQVNYWYCDGHFFCYTESDACLKELDPDGNVVREICRTGETDEGFHGRWAFAPNGTIYSYSFTYSVDTESPSDNGKIFKWVGGKPEVYVDFGAANCIYSVTPFEDRLLVVVKPNNHGSEYYYVIDGVANKVPR
jgi:prepilin-type processing-associated H-X9-DG protein